MTGAVGFTSAGRCHLLARSMLTGINQRFVRQVSLHLNTNKIRRAETTCASLASLGSRAF